MATNLNLDPGEYSAGLAYRPGQSSRRNLTPSWSSSRTVAVLASARA